MITVNIHDAPAQLPELFAKALAGESIEFRDGDEVVLEIRKPLQAKPFGEKQVKRKPSLGNAPFPMEIPDSFFDPLPDDMLDAFEGKNSDKL